MRNILFSLLFTTATLSLMGENVPSENYAQRLDIASLPLEQLIQEHGAKLDNPISKSLKGKTISSSARFLRPTVIPYSQIETYVNGHYSHVGYYNNGIVITVLEGPLYGYQTIVDYNGFLLAANPYYQINFVYGGTYFQHEYIDCTIITGQDQVMILK